MNTLPNHVVNHIRKYLSVEERWKSRPASYWLFHHFLVLPTEKPNPQSFRALNDNNIRTNDNDIKPNNNQSSPSPLRYIRLRPELDVKNALFRFLWNTDNRNIFRRNHGFLRSLYQLILSVIGTANTNTRKKKNERHYTDYDILYYRKPLRRFVNRYRFHPQYEKAIDLVIHIRAGTLKHYARKIDELRRNILKTPSDPPKYSKKWIERIRSQTKKDFFDDVVEHRTRLLIYNIEHEEESVNRQQIREAKRLRRNHHLRQTPSSVVPSHAVLTPIQASFRVPLATLTQNITNAYGVQPKRNTYVRQAFNSKNMIEARHKGKAKIK